MATTSYRLATILSSSGNLTTSGIIGLMPYLQLNGLVWPALLTRQALYRQRSSLATVASDIEPLNHIG